MGPRDQTGGGKEKGLRLWKWVELGAGALGGPTNNLAGKARPDRFEKNV